MESALALLTTWYGMVLYGMVWMHWPLIALFQQVSQRREWELAIVKAEDAWLTIGLQVSLYVWINVCMYVSTFIIKPSCLRWLKSMLTGILSEWAFSTQFVHEIRVWWYCINISMLVIVQCCGATILLFVHRSEWYEAYRAKISTAANGHVIVYSGGGLHWCLRFELIHKIRSMCVD